MVTRILAISDPFVETFKPPVGAVTYQRLGLACGHSPAIRKYSVAAVARIGNSFYCYDCEADATLRVLKGR